MSFFRKFFGGGADRQLREWRPLVDRINALEADFRSCSDLDLRSKKTLFQARLAEGETLAELLPEAFAAVREAARRTLGERHYDVQLLAGIALHHGQVAEMRTGEGKTLSATLAVYLNALEGSGVHLITVNDYLARRDGVWMGQIYDALGLTVGILNHQSSFGYVAQSGRADRERDHKGAYHVVEDFLQPISRQAAYQADVTYGTNHEFGFDYLRDNLAYRLEDVAQIRGHNFAIIDEVDSVLIDEARTPLIISAPTAEGDDLYQAAARVAAALEEKVDFEIDEKAKAATLTQGGISRAEKLLGVNDIYTDRGIKYVHHLETAVRAKALFKKDHHYVVQAGEIVIVDEFTGRLQPGRRWSDGLHQAIEAKEGVKIKEESKTYASITLQNYFKLYHKLSGMTGTAKTSAEEFKKVYGLPVVEIPTHRPSARQDLTDLVFQTEAGKFLALAKKIKELNARGQPVLVGTVSIEKNELVGEYLNRVGVKHEILNAKNHEREGEIIAGAGKKGSVVIATNMAGRGVDIKLGGAEAAAAEYDEVKALGGLCVIGTERHEARRIDNQLRGRAGRQGDPGLTQFYISFDDSLLRVFTSERVRAMIQSFKLPPDEPIQNRLVARSIESAQRKIEGLHFDARRQLLEYDNVLNRQRSAIYARRQKILAGELEFLKAEVLAADPAIDLESKLAGLAEEKIVPTLRRLLLSAIDVFWVDHLETMDYLKSSIRLRAYGQRDPFIEYKKEGLNLFRQLERNINEHITQAVANLSGELSPEAARPVVNLNLSKEKHQHDPKVALPAEVARSATKVGRNDPCPCGSGKKYKKCHGA